MKRPRIIQIIESWSSQIYFMHVIHGLVIVITKYRAKSSSSRHERTRDQSQKTPI